MEWTEGTESRARIDVDENNEEGFRIFRKSGDLELWDGTLTGYTELDSVGQDVTSWTDDVDLETGTYRYIVTAYNGGGNSIPRTEAPVIVIAPPPNESPTQPEGLAEVSVAENTRTTGASYTSTDPEGTTPLEWSLTGDDAGRLDIEGGLLTFPTAPDFENPKDRDKDRVYQVEVVASDGELSSPSLAVAVTVLNVNEPGMVSLTSTTLNLTAMAPEIGMQLTAMLSDPDEGVRGEAWHWQSSADGDAWTPILGANGDRVTGPTYTVEVTDRGRRLRATVTYLDGLSIDGTDRRTASSGGTAPVSGLAGSITGTESWSGDVYVGGDVTIERGASLTISGAVVHFLAPEGSDGNGRSELIVASGGSLAAGAGVSFRSGGTAEAHGLRVETGGTATLSGLTIADGEHRLRAGPGDLIVRGDLKVAGGATLHIHQDSEVRFEDRTDETAGGESRNLSEVIVLGTLRASEVRFRTVHDDPESPGWYGIRARRVASRRGAVVLRESRLSHGQRCVHDQGGSLVLVNTRFEDCGLIRGPRSVSFMENGEGVVETYRSRPELRRPDGYETLRWKLKKVLGEDTGDFTLSGSGQLRFRPPPPDFEAPRGSDPDNPNNYRVTIEAREANYATATQRVVVSVSDVNEPGTVTLSPDPGTDPAPLSVGTELTASLSDPDEPVSGLAWQWQRQAPEATAWQAIPEAGAREATYRAERADIGHRLRATVSYTDAHGPSPPAESPRTGLVEGADTDMNTAGEVTFENANPPRSGHDVTAVLRDPDRPIRDVEWVWKRVPETGRPIATDDTDGDALYTPVAADVDHALEATATYRDRHGPEQRAAGTTPAVQTRHVGSITLTNIDPPLVGELVEATLEDDDIPADNPPAITWAWVRLASTSSETDEPRPSTTNQYRPVGDDEGRRLRVTATYDDGTGPALQTASRTTPAVEVNTAGSIRLGGVWNPPQANSRITAEVRDPDATPAQRNNATWAWDVTYDSTDREARRHTGPTFTPGNGDIGGLIRVTAVYDDRYENDNRIDGTTGEVQPNGDYPPTITPLAKQDVRENSETLVGTYEATDREDDAPTLRWSRTGTDADSFQLDPISGHGNRRALHFEDAPNYEDKRIYSVTLRVEDSAGNVTTHPVTARVINVAETGSITFEPSAPQACSSGRVVLRDPDGGIQYRPEDSPPGEDFLYGWTYDYPPVPGGREPAAAPSPTSITKSYQPPDEAVGNPVTLTIRYGDEASTRNTLTKVSGTVVANIPRPPGDLEAAAGVRQVTLSWTAPDDCGADILDYQYQYRKDGETRWQSGTTTSLRVTIPNLDGGQEYDFKVRGRNGPDRYGGYTHISATPDPPPTTNRPPVLSGTFEVTVDEGSTTVGVYTGSDPDEGDTITWTEEDPLGGDDGSLFRLTGTGDSRTLRFKTARNYEQHEHRYTVEVEVTDSHGLATARTVTVNLRNINDPPTITINPATPQACRRFTATLHDEDGAVRVSRWLWNGETITRTGPRTHPAPPPTAANTNHTPKSEDAGENLELAVTYSDEIASDQTVTKTFPVVTANHPEAPTLSGTAGVGQVALSWTAPNDCGSTITHYDYRYRPNPSGAWSAWQDTTATSVTVSPLTNDVEYTFEVRAHNGRGASRVAAITRRPLSNTPDPDATLTLTADDPPYVLTAMIANFSHPGAGTVTQWAWYRLTRADQEESSDNHITGQITNRYVPREADLNHWIRVIATYNDHHAQGRTVAATTAQAVQRGDHPGTITFTGIDPPLVNREITATLHDDDNPTNLAWQWDVAGAAGARPEGRIDEGNTYTPGSGHVGSRIRAQVIYDDDFGTGKIVRNTTPAVQASSTLTLTEISKQDVRENTQRLAGVYESIDPQGRPVSWSLIGTDPTSFQLRDVSGHANRKELRFKTAPNYEGQSSYSVTVRVSAAGVTKTRTVPVTVLDGPDTGTITLAPTTTQTCARIVATLRDEDSGLHFNQSLAPAGFTYGWLWDPRYFPSDGGQAASVTTQDYIPPNSSVGQWIEVTVRYGDDQGDREEVLERSSSRVLANTPRVPTLSGTAGVGQVALSWTKPGDCGSTSLWGANGPR